MEIRCWMTVLPGDHRQEDGAPASPGSSSPPLSLQTPLSTPSVAATVLQTLMRPLPK
jgi:hypothetical protein